MSIHRFAHSLRVITRSLRHLVSRKPTEYAEINSKRFRYNFEFGNIGNFVILESDLICCFPGAAPRLLLVAGHELVEGGRAVGRVLHGRRHRERLRRGADRPNHQPGEPRGPVW